MEILTNLPPDAQEVRPRPRIVARRALRVLGALLFASACCLAMVLIRRAYAHYWDQTFLVWNLVLAWVPLPFSIAAYHMQTTRTRRGLLFLVCALTWFVFFPNAPYITTDFVHLHQERLALTWIDLISIASFAWVGLCLGFCSLYLMQEVVAHRLGRLVGWLFVLVMFAAASFGTFLGRFLRWNSWDVLHHPLAMLDDLHTSAAPSPEATRVYLGMMFLFLLLSYCALFALTHLHEGSER